MSIAKKLLEEGKGVYRLAPTWVPRSFCRPGKRIKLHPDDYYVLGLERGGIDERWFASTTWAENGPGTPDDEGLSYIVSKDGSERVLLRDAVDELGGEVIGDNLWNKYHKWPMFSKFFDNAGPRYFRGTRTDRNRLHAKQRRGKYKRNIYKLHLVKLLYFTRFT